MTDSFKAKTSLAVGQQTYEIFSLAALKSQNVDRLPFSLKILLENLLRFEDGVNVTRADVEALLKWDPKAAPNYEIAFTPARVIMQDFTGVPVRGGPGGDARGHDVKLGGNPDEINPLAPAELVIDHSVQVDRIRHARLAGGEQQRNRVQNATASATCVPALGPVRVPQLQSRTAQYRHRASGQSWNGWARVVFDND